MGRMLLLCCGFLLFWSHQAAAFDHSLWGELLQKHVLVLEEGRVSQVDYGGLAEQRAQLRSYLQKLSAITKQQFDTWPKDEQLAFLLNAYNSWTVELILTKYPDLESIKDLGSLFQSPWKKKFIPLFGEQKSLDDIEHGLIRDSGRYNDPRIHFAANCASIGCPALRPEPYLGSRLQSQLNEAASLFLRDRSRNRVEGQVAKISSIFKWYRQDFEQGFRAISSLEQFLADHADDLDLTEDQKNQLQNKTIRIKFLDYNWKLNKVDS